MFVEHALAWSIMFLSSECNARTSRRYYDRDERAASVAASALGNAGVPRASLADQQAAQQWIQAAMATAEPGPSDAAALAERAQRLSSPSLRVIGQVLGLGEEVSVIRARLGELNAYTLSALQQSLNNMGGVDHRPGK